MNMIETNIEKAKSFVRVDTEKDIVVAGFVDAKCTDEGKIETKCQSIVAIQSCHSIDVVIRKSKCVIPGTDLCA